MKHRVVCISRMTAAGCEPIGQTVADRLGFQYVDDEVITLAAERWLPGSADGDPPPAAPSEARVLRLWLPNKLVSKEDYAAAIAESDRQRQRYLARFHNIQDESATHYDLVINTDALGIEQAVAAIVAAATT